ncbi:uncharacterized protein [Oscarella lobularis]|uniref:uncharacterized protein n=1 Tax=Oscarella lobularis TaxID=121494 RepID=UPI0033131DFB
MNGFAHDKGKVCPLWTMKAEDFFSSNGHDKVTIIECHFPDRVISEEVGLSYLPDLKLEFFGNHIYVTDMSGPVHACVTARIVLQLGLQCSRASGYVFTEHRRLEAATQLQPDVSLSPRQPKPVRPIFFVEVAVSQSTEAVLKKAERYFEWSATQAVLVIDVGTYVKGRSSTLQKLDAYVVTGPSHATGAHRPISFLQPQDSNLPLPLEFASSQQLSLDLNEIRLFVFDAIDIDDE